MSQKITCLFEKLPAANAHPSVAARDTVNRLEWPGHANFYRSFFGCCLQGGCSEFGRPCPVAAALSRSALKRRMP